MKPVIPQCVNNPDYRTKVRRGAREKRPVKSTAIFSRIIETVCETARACRMRARSFNRREAAVSHDERARIC